jgi:hypothetical protein
LWPQRLGLKLSVKLRAANYTNAISIEETQVHKMTSKSHRAGRIPLHPEAFSHDLRSRSKRPRQENQAHLKFIRGLPCLVCGTRKDIQAAHIRAPSVAYGKRHTGKGEKPSDVWALPVCAEHHRQQHLVNELSFWKCVGIDPLAIALALFAATGDDERAELVVKLAGKRP